MIVPSNIMIESFLSFFHSVPKYLDIHPISSSPPYCFQKIDRVHQRSPLKPFLEKVKYNWIFASSSFQFHPDFHVQFLLFAQELKFSLSTFFTTKEYKWYPKPDATQLSSASRSESISHSELKRPLVVVVEQQQLQRPKVGWRPLLATFGLDCTNTEVETVSRPEKAFTLKMKATAAYFIQESKKMNSDPMFASSFAPMHFSYRPEKMYKKRTFFPCLIRM
jgi:hypothetical protein